MGGIGLSGDGTLFVVYSRTSASSYISTMATYQASGDAINTIRAPQVIAAGKAGYVGTRWGDYVGVAPDPMDAAAVWQGDEYPAMNGGWATWVSKLMVDEIAPAGVAIQAMPAFQRASSFTVRWSATDSGSGIASYDVRYRQAPWNGSFGNITLWRSATTATSVTFAGAPGNTHCFSTRARDKAGNVSAWSVERCTAVPLDDRSLVASAYWTRGSSTSYFRGTFSRSATNGASLVRTSVRAKRLSVLATKCATCGTLRVYWNGVLKAQASLYATTTSTKQLVASVSFSTVQSGTVKIVVYGSRRAVIVDGLGVSRV
jgi:hypothetical protein